MKIIYFFILFVIISFAVFFTVYDANKNESLRREYPHLLKQIEIVGEITNLDTSHGLSYVTINDSIKFRLQSSGNELYEGNNAYLSRLLSVGDSLFKQSNTDSLIVKKEEKEYLYVIGEVINKGASIGQN